MIHVLGELFGWPYGIVVGNLIASVLWATPALLHLHAKLNAQHGERIAQAARHHQQVLQAISAGREQPGRLPAAAVSRGMGKENRVRRRARRDAGRVIAWLRSPEGENWDSRRIGVVHRHTGEDGMFASVLRDPVGAGRQARWPEPFGGHDLDKRPEWL